MDFVKKLASGELGLDDKEEVGRCTCIYTPCTSFLAFDVVHTFI